MINKNRIYFGYGDICVGSNSLLMVMTFQQFKPPADVGSTVEKDVNFVSEEKVIHFNINNYETFNKLLKQVKNDEIRIFEFDGLIFDFSNYDVSSVDVCIGHFNSAMQQYYFCMAC